jgi:hypothetical protein
VAWAIEGDAAAVAAGLTQEDPPLDPNEANAQGLTPLFGAFKLLLQVEQAQNELAASNLQRPSQATRSAMALNAELSADLERTVKPSW